jgi:two-component system, sensor histidine kinase
MSFRLHCALVLTLSCVGGILLTVWVAMGYLRHGELRQQFGPDSVTQSEARRLDDVCSQFLLTADLVVASGESFLGAGNAAQGAHAQEIVSQLATSELTRGATHTTQAISQNISTILECTNIASMATGANRDAILAQTLTRLDPAAEQLLNELASLRQTLSNSALARIDFLDQQLASLHNQTLLSGIIYLALVMLIWRFQVRTLVQPVIKLSQATSKASEQTRKLLLEPSGPTETRQLAKSIAGLHSRLQGENQRIEAVVENRTRDLIIANKAKDDFLATMSHELRTPLNGVIGMLDILMQDGMKDEHVNMMRIASSSSNHLQSLINDMLDYSKMSAGRMTLEAVSYNIRDCVSEVTECMRFIAKEKSLAFLCQVDPAVPNLIKTDPLRLRQVLFNLIGNALKFTEHGAVGVSVSLCEENEGSALQIAIRDSGIGMSAEVIDKLFEPFTQADSSVTRQYGGTGLGLSISQRLVDLLGGSIRVESENSKGSVFHVTWPYQECLQEDNEIQLSRKQIRPEVAALTPTANAETQSGSKKKILLVEDNLVNQLVAKRMLERAGYAVAVANNGHEALAELEREAIDLVLMDLQMPVMGGIDATNKIRSRETTGSWSPGCASPLPILALTASTLDRDRQTCMQAGVNEVLKKPIRSKDLVNCVGSWLAQNQSKAN